MSSGASVHKTLHHDVRVVKVHQVSNGQVTIHLRCCNNPSTDYPCTFGVSVPGTNQPHQFTAQEIDKKLAAAGKIVAAHHGAVTTVVQHAKKYLTTGGK